MINIKRRRLLLAAGAAGAVAVAGITTAAIGAGGPADKVVAAGGYAETATFAEDTDVTLLTTKFKTSKPTDLMIHTSAECSIGTKFERGGKLSENVAGGNVQVWLELDGKVVPIQAVSSPPQDGSDPPAGDKEKDSVTFCHRDEGYEKADNNIECQETPLPLPAGDQCEFEKWFQNTKSANSFNWVKLNSGAGDHVLEMKGRLTTDEESSAGDLSEATAAVGNRFMIVEPTKMGVNSAILDVGTTTQ